MENNFDRKWYGRLQHQPKQMLSHFLRSAAVRVLQKWSVSVRLCLLCVIFRQLRPFHCTINNSIVECSKDS